MVFKYVKGCREEGAEWLFPFSLRTEGKWFTETSG